MKYNSALVTQASGSIGGLVASHNAGGAYFRKRVIPTDPATAQMLAVRLAMSTLAQAWNTDLTSVQRAAWSLYAENVTHTDALGASIHLSGIAEYIRSNTGRLQMGVARVDDAPTQFDLGQLSAVSVDTVTAPDVLKIAFTNTDPWAIAAGGYLAIYQSSAQNAGVGFFKGPFRFVGKVTGSGTPPTSPYTVPTTLLYPVVSGKKTFVRLRAYGPDGRTTEATVVSKSA